MSGAGWNVRVWVRLCVCVCVYVCVCVFVCVFECVVCGLGVLGEFLMVASYPGSLGAEEKEPGIYCVRMRVINICKPRGFRWA